MATEDTSAAPAEDPDAVRTDDDLVGEIEQFAAELGRRPGRDPVAARLGVGSSKAGRLLKLYDEKHGRPLEPVPDSDQSTDEPTASTGQPDQSADQSSEAVDHQSTGDRPDQSGNRSTASDQDGRPVDRPDQSTSTGQPDQSSEAVDHAAADQSGNALDQSGRPVEQPQPDQSGRPVGQAVGSLIGVVTKRLDPDRSSSTGTRPVDSTDEQTGLSVWSIVGLSVIAVPAFLAVWSGWLGLAEKTGWGDRNLLPGLVRDGGFATVDTSLFLGLGIEAYGAMALAVFLRYRKVRGMLRGYAFASAVGSLLLGAAGQVAFHVMEINGTGTAGGLLTGFVSVLPVLVLGAAAGLIHLVAEQPRKPKN